VAEAVNETAYFYLNPIYSAGAAQAYVAEDQDGKVTHPAPQSEVDVLVDHGEAAADVGNDY
jgi:hypothetical protein